MRGIQSILAVGALLVGFSAQAEVSEEEFNELKDQYAELAEKVDGQNKSSREKSSKSGVSWADRIGISGDFRYRYENIDEEDKDERNRSRIRARAAIKANLPNSVEVGFGLASGGEDPVSANQTLGGGGSSKGINLDLAYASWSGISNTVLTLGKFKNPFFKPANSAMLWDGDWRPEGLTATWDNGTLFGTVLGSWLVGDSNDGTEFAWGGQAGVKAELGGAAVTVGAGYYDISVAGRETTFGDADDFFGNSFTCTDPMTPAGCTYDINYEEIEVFAEVGLDLAGLPVMFFADFVQNQDADTEDTGWAAGVKLGKAKDKGEWELGYLYQELEADAVLGLVSDSDWAGGGTDNKGHKLTAAYGFSQMVAVKATYFINEINVASGNPNDYDRLMLDLQFKFK